MSLTAFDQKVLHIITRCPEVTGAGIHRALELEWEQGRLRMLGTLARRLAPFLAPSIGRIDGALDKLEGARLVTSRWERGGHLPRRYRAVQ
jgi:DNA-binding PadR family transcriptional regulator